MNRIPAAASATVLWVYLNATNVVITRGQFDLRGLSFLFVMEQGTPCYRMAGKMRSFTPLRQPSFSPAVSMSVARQLEPIISQKLGSSYIMRAPAGAAALPHSCRRALLRRLLLTDDPGDAMCCLTGDDSESSDEDFREVTPAFSMAGPGSSSGSEDSDGPRPPKRSPSRAASVLPRRRASDSFKPPVWSDDPVVLELQHKLQVRCFEIGCSTSVVHTHWLQAAVCISLARHLLAGCSLYPHTLSFIEIPCCAAPGSPAVPSSGLSSEGDRQD